MITPLEISKLDFSKKVRGYSKSEVDSIMNLVSKTLEQHLVEKTELKSKMKVLEDRLQNYEQIDQVLKDSALTMQSLIEEKRKQADQEAQMIIQDARQKASSQVIDYEDKVKDLKKEIDYLNNQKTDYFIKFKHFVDSQKDWLQAMSEMNTEASPNKTNSEE